MIFAVTHCQSRSHYSRRKVGSKRFAPPGSPLILERPGVVWGVIKQKHVEHAWPGAWLNFIFRNETRELSSALIVAAVAKTIEVWGMPPRALITFIDAEATKARRSKLSRPGKCYLDAGWREIGRTKKNDLVVLEAPL